MSPEPLAADRTYQNLKRDIVTGKYMPGVSLPLQRLAEEFGTSITPIRDAIHRMVGERLIAMLPGGGFQLPVLNIQQLRELYSWHDMLVRQALHGRISPAAFHTLPDEPCTEGADDEIAHCAAEFFATAAAASGSEEVIQAVANTADRLSLARLREPLLMKDTARELNALVSLAKSGNVAAIRVAIREYHRRRLRRIDRIVLALRG